MIVVDWKLAWQWLLFRETAKGGMTWAEAWLCILAFLEKNMTPQRKVQGSTREASDNTSLIDEDNNQWRQYRGLLFPNHVLTLSWKVSALIIGGIELKVWVIFSLLCWVDYFEMNFLERTAPFKPKVMFICHSFIIANFILHICGLVCFLVDIFFFKDFFFLSFRLFTI